MMALLDLYCPWTAYFNAGLPALQICDSPPLLLQDSYLRAPSGSLRNLLLDKEFWECKADLEKQTQKVADLQEELEVRIKENANLGNLFNVC